jgi:hypothetical protein
MLNEQDRAMPCLWSCTDAMVALPKRGSHGHRAHRAARGGMEDIAQTRVLVRAQRIRCVRAHLHGVIAFYASARSLQIGNGVEVIALTSVTANLIAILVFHDPIGSGALGITGRFLAFFLVIAGAALMPPDARHHRRGLCSTKRIPWNTSRFVQRPAPRIAKTPLAARQQRLDQLPQLIVDQPRLRSSSGHRRFPASRDLHARSLALGWTRLRWSIEYR